jgi:6-phosphogluconolactonase/glucosamine-6-phosphate isomerase/deaminase
MMERTEMEQCRWHEVADERALHQLAIETILASAVLALRERSRYHIVLAGGSMPRGIYQGLCNCLMIGGEG